MEAVTVPGSVDATKISVQSVEATIAEPEDG
jgi:hypothetical protein